VRIWDPSTGQELAVLTGHTDGVVALVVAPDGSWLASAGADTTVRIWNPRSGTESVVLDKHLDEVVALAVAPDGSWLASIGRDRTVRLRSPDGRLSTAVRLNGPLALARWTAPDRLVVAGTRGLYLFDVLSAAPAGGPGAVTAPDAGTGEGAAPAGA
jgi:WD40 repeat protein